MVGQVLLQPLDLCGLGVATANLVAFTVQRDDVPGPEFVAVISPGWISGSCSKIPGVCGCASAAVLVISRSRSCAVLEATPGHSVAVVELLIRAVRIRQVADSEHRAWNFFDKLCSGLRA